MSWMEERDTMEDQLDTTFDPRGNKWDQWVQSEQEAEHSMFPPPQVPPPVLSHRQHWPSAPENLGLLQSLAKRRSDVAPHENSPHAHAPDAQQHFYSFSEEPQFLLKT